jgi:hypothetical protein
MTNQEILENLVRQVEDLSEEIESVLLRDDDNDNDELDVVMFEFRVLVDKLREFTVKD